MCAITPAASVAAGLPRAVGEGQSVSYIGAGRTAPKQLSMRQVLVAWAPLAASWLLMGLELSAVGAVMARLPDPAVSLAAYGGVVFPIALIIESPIIMLLAASTALAVDAVSYRVIWRFMLVVAGALTALHALIAFTPLFDVVAMNMLGVPEALREPARWGMQLMLPWTFSIASRRTHQGLLIRFGRSKAVTLGTVVRLASNITVLSAGYLYGQLPGIVVGCAGVACGVSAEAVVAAVCVRPVLRQHINGKQPAGDPLTLRAFLYFYVPLMLTPFINFFAMPLAAASMSRMPMALESLAVWPVLNGIAFAMRSTGYALNEVVVAQLDLWRPVPALRRFAWILAAATSAPLLLMALSPLGMFWFQRVAALSPALAMLAAAAFAMTIPLPAMAALQSLYQGVLVHSRRTQGITESVAALLLGTVGVLALGIAWQGPAGIMFAAAALVLGNAAQTGWVWWRARGDLALVEGRDGLDPEPATGAHSAAVETAD